MIYEASSSIQAVEGFIVRARIAPTAFGQPAAWTAWYYFPPDSFQITTGVEGVFADAFDFSDFGGLSRSAAETTPVKRPNLAPR